jgi:hypothetical protein
LTDGILILRYLFAPEGSWNYSDALGTDATRTARDEIRVYLDLYNPPPSAASTLELTAVSTVESTVTATTQPDATSAIAAPLVSANESEPSAQSQIAAAPPALLANAPTSPTVVPSTESVTHVLPAAASADIPADQARRPGRAVTVRVDAAQAAPLARQPDHESVAATEALLARAADAVLVDVDAASRNEARLAAAYAWLSSADGDREAADQLFGVLGQGRDSITPRPGIGRHEWRR